MIEGGKGLHIEMLSMQKKYKRLRTIDIEYNALSFKCAASL